MSTALALRIPRSTVIGIVLLAIASVALFGPDILQSNEILAAFRSAAGENANDPGRDVTDAVGDVIQVGDSASDTIAALQQAGFVQVGETDHIEGVVPPPPISDKFLEFSRPEHWWSAFLYDQYHVVLGIAGENVNWMMAHIRRQSL